LALRYRVTFQIITQKGGSQAQYGGLLRLSRKRLNLGMMKQLSFVEQGTGGKGWWEKHTQISQSLWPWLDSVGWDSTKP
jgi:hypothetical protein